MEKLLCKEIKDMVNEYKHWFLDEMKEYDFLIYIPDPQDCTNTALINKMMFFHRQTHVINDINEVSHYNVSKLTVFVFLDNYVDEFIKILNRCIELGLDGNMVLSKSEVFFFFRCIISLKISLDSKKQVREYLEETKNTDGLVILDNLDKCKDCYDLLSDNESKKVYLRILTKKIINCRNCNDIVSGNQYFNENIFEISNSEIYVDAGSFNGDTIKEFVDRFKNYSSIYAIEPYLTEYTKLLDSTKKYRDIHYINAGLGDREDQLLFSEMDNGASKFDKNGTVERSLITGDSLMINPTFIKMDIEGYELKALMGFKQTIKKCSPKLAICIYHKVEDLWEIPLYIYKTFNYKQFFIRHHSNNFCETVFYAKI